LAGSHDLAVEALSRMAAEHLPGVSLALDYVGSLGGLMALARNEADIAGSHLWDASSNTYNEAFVRRILLGRRVVSLSLAYRSLGLVVPPGNPHQIQGLADLPNMDGSLVNRQPGSGTRVWLDVQLQALGLDPASIPGYDNAETTHLAVARAVAEGEATVAIAIQAAAAAYGLDFIPLTQEKYDLVMTEEAWQSAAMQTLVTFVQSPHFKDALASLGGYQPVADGPRLLTN
jgi:putative molybdopterin biosynthesis protein